VADGGGGAYFYAAAGKPLMVGGQLHLEEPAFPFAYAQGGCYWAVPMYGAAYYQVCS